MNILNEKEIDFLQSTNFKLPKQTKESSINSCNTCIKFVYFFFVRGDQCDGWPIATPLLFKSLHL
jgi:hypothetical protein